METHVTFVLDETGSMESLKPEVISGFNKYVDDMRSDGQGYAFSLIKFDSAHKTWIHRKVQPGGIERLTPENYRPGAMTPLYDTVFLAIKETEKDTAEGQKVMVVVLTDGLENASATTSAEQMRDLIKYKEGEGWAFLYLGVAPDAWANERSFAGTGMAQNSYMTDGPIAMASAIASASSVRTEYSRAAAPDVTYLVSDEEKRRVASKNEH